MIGKAIILRMTYKINNFFKLTILPNNSSKFRSLVTNHGASNKFTLSFLEKNWSHVENSQYFYISVWIILSFR